MAFTLLGRLFAKATDGHFFKWAISGLFLVYFRSFKKTSIQFYNKLMLKNVHLIFDAGIRNLRPLEHKPPPITTRPGRTLAVHSTSVVKYFLNINPDTKSYAEILAF